MKENKEEKEGRVTSDALCLKPPDDSQAACAETTHAREPAGTKMLQEVKLRPQDQMKLNLQTREEDDGLISLTVRLQRALVEGDKDKAVELVTELADRKADVKLDERIFCAELASPLDQEIRVRVYVEDKVHSGTYVVMKLKPSTTIKQLKRKMMLQYKFPEEVQRWVIGKKLPKDRDTLAKHGIRVPDSAIFLYVQSARTVGLSRSRFQRQIQAIETAGSDAATPQTPNYCTLPRRSSGSLTPGTPATPGLAWPGATMHRSASASSTPQSASASSMPRSASASSGLEAALGTRIAEAEQLIEQATAAAAATGIEEKQELVMGQPHNTLPVQATEEPAAPLQQEQVGWHCDACTYINPPLRPGCKMCSSARPTEYQVPDNYEMTEEERAILADQHTAAQLYEEEMAGDIKANEVGMLESQLRMLLQFNDHIQEHKRLSANNPAE